MALNKKVMLLIMYDLGSAFLAIPIAFLFRFKEIPTADKLMELGASRIFLFAFVLVVVSYLVETYKHHRNARSREIVVRIIMSLVLSFFILSTLYYSVPFFMFGRGVIVIALLVFGALQILCFAGNQWSKRFRGFAKRILILGAGPLAGRMGDIIPVTDGNYLLSGYVNCSNEAVHVPAWTILETRGNLYETARREKADQIVVSLTERRGVLPLQEIMNCKLSGIEVVDAPSFYEQMTGKLLLENINPSWFIFSDGFRITALTRGIKRVLDVVCSAAGILVTLPFLPFIVLAIKLDSPGPVLFRQERVGENERNFVLFKFRTMREDAESGTGAVWAQKEDPRVTRVGNFYRKSRIDELPQLFNVLKGDMSLVGPRPERPEFVEKLKTVIPYYSERHFVKPGVTGWAQVRYPYGASVEDALEKLRYDLYYIKNLSLTFDMMIILETVKVVLFRRGGR
jgi:sugar transferase (PEP-CTERM system associated)